MHDVYDKLSTQDLAMLLCNTEEGLKAVSCSLHETEVGDYYDAFLDETCELICYLFTHFSKEE